MAKPNRYNSIYQQKGSKPGLTIKDGMLINNRPDGMTGIQQAAMLRKASRRAEKTSMMADATYLGYTRAESMEGMNGMEGCCE
jgi:hypothetical protein